MDGDSPLTAETGGNDTYYLYGLGVIGEKTTAQNFSLPDGLNTPRQLSNASGAITLSVRYTQWGDTLELNGTGNFAFGYFGGTIDAATGLIYVGNGQYYDPETGRFLTRDAKPNNINVHIQDNDRRLVLRSFYFYDRYTTECDDYQGLLYLFTTLATRANIKIQRGGYYANNKLG